MRSIHCTPRDTPKRIKNIHPQRHLYMNVHSSKIHTSAKVETGTSLVAQWLRPCAPNAGGQGSIPGQGTRSHMHAATKEPASCN